MKHKKFLLRSGGTAVFLGLLMLLLVVTPALADTEGPNYPDTGTDVEGVGEMIWLSPENIVSADETYATTTLSASVSERYSHYLVATDFDFAIPAGATINGITVSINRFASNAGTISDYHVHLVKGGVIQTGTDKAITGTYWPTADPATATYGGPADLWGDTWTAEHMNALDFGVALSIQNATGTYRIAAVDYITVTVHYGLPGTTTAVNCGGGDPVVTYGSGISCVVTVTSSVSANTPTGSVNLTTDGSGSFTACSLSGSDGTATCTTTYTPDAVGTGSHLITASYAGDEYLGSSSGTQTVTVNKATPTLSVTNSPVVYNGSPRAAGVAANVDGTVSGIQYNGSATVPTNAGTYAVTANFVPADTANYNNLTGAAAGDFVIQKASPTLSVTNSPQVYDGTPKAAVVEGGVAGTASNVKYDGSATTPTNVGTYAVTADFTSSDPNYKDLTGASAGDFVIEKAAPTLTITNSPQTYDGTPKAVVVVGSVTGSVSNILYDGSETVPTNAGTYEVTANFTSSDPNYKDLTGASAGDFVIQKAIPTLSTTNSPQVYDGTPKAAEVEGSVAGTVSDVKYDDSVTAPTNTGAYIITADFVPADTANYNSLTDAAAGIFVIQKATPTLSVTNSPQVYDGTPKTAAVEGSVPGTVTNILHNGSATAPTNAGTYTVTANFVPTDAANYNSLTGAAAGTFVIGKATPTLSVTNSPQVYDGTPKAAVVEGSVAGTASSVQYGGAATVPTDAGTYAVTANFVPTDTTNYISLTGAAAGDFVIEKADPVLSVTNSPQVYDGTPKAAGVAGNVPGAVSSIRYDGVTTAPTNAGTYAVTASFIPTDTANYNSLTGADAGDFVIQKATPTLSVTNSPQPYDGTPKAAEVESDVPGAVSNIQYDGSETIPTDAGAYAVTADFVPTDTANYNSLTGAAAGTFVIGKATPTLSVTNSPQIYDGTPKAAVVEGSVAGTIGDVKYDGSATVPTDAGTYAVTADFTSSDPSYIDLADAPAGSFVIEKADPVLSVTNSPQVYDGTPKAAGVAGNVPGAVSSIRYDGVTTAPTNAGTYAVTASFIPTDTANYNSLTGADAGGFVIQKATPTLSVTNSPVAYNGEAQAAEVEGSVPGVVSSVQYDGTAAAPTNVGTYAVTADFVPTDTVNYNSLTGAAAGSFVIEKADPVLSVTNSPQIYDGTPKAAVVESDVPGVVSSVLYDGSATAPTDVGTYAVTADFVPTDTANYNSLTGAAAGNFVIAAGEPVLELVKTAVPDTYLLAGDEITYTYELTNIGNTPLEGPFTVEDDRATVTCPDTASLDPEDSLACTAVYTITEDDVNAGSVTNTATAYGKYMDEEVVSNTVEVTITLWRYRIYLPIIFR